MNRRSWVLVVAFSLLGVSLLLNLFLFGVMAGKRAEPGASQARAALGALVADVPPELRSEVRRSLMAERRVLGRELRAIGQARQRIGALLAAPELDEAALREAFASLQGHTATSQRLVHETLMEVMIQADSADRQSWAEHWRRLRAAPGLLRPPPPADAGPESRPEQEPRDALP